MDPNEDTFFLPVDNPTDTVSAEVKFLDLYDGKVFYTKGYRIGKRVRRLVVKDEARWIKMQAITINCQLYKIYGWVKREGLAAVKLRDDNGEVPLRNEYTGEILNLIKDTDTPTPIKNGFVQPFSVDLHEIYEGRCPDSPPVFKLSRSDQQRNLNVFQLVVQLEFIDGSRSQKFTSPKFNLRILTATETSQIDIQTPQGPVQVKRAKCDVEIDSSVNGQGSSGESVDSGVFDDGFVRHHRQILVETLDA
ncbi:uncharacterized protein LOC114537522 isoform X1 [Dendronephthya gigantea]|uniref:uncharacterized protein LOC114537522 isoform X1 n=1 Tax=Dendronephthya gigantea TaxID=151771 RepID=UPI0010694E5A|nr:uncharacterized protein LOC114537522 isoform X1 [Dendronephthya gigantea]